MADLTFIGSVLVAVFGFFLFYRYGPFRKSGSTENAASAATTVIDKGEGRSQDGHDDVIIVGAGVAGAALAHTLGKVVIIFFVSIYCVLFFIYFWICINISWLYILFLISVLRLTMICG